MNLKDALKGRTLTSWALYRCVITVLGKDICEYKKENYRQQYDKNPIVLRNATKSHQKILQTYHDLITNKNKQDMSLYTDKDWTNCLIVRKRKDDPDLPRGNSSDAKPKIIELDRKIGHKSVMSICELFIDRDEPDHLVDQAIHDMEGIGDASAEEDNGTYQLVAAYLSVDGSAAL